jgi:hypothetical protein
MRLVRVLWARKRLQVLDLQRLYMGQPNGFFDINA